MSNEKAITTGYSKLKLVSNSPVVSLGYEPIVTVKEARRILGKEAIGKSDLELIELINNFDAIAEHLIRSDLVPKNQVKTNLL